MLNLSSDIPLNVSKSSEDDLLQTRYFPSIILYLALTVFSYCIFYFQNISGSVFGISFVASAIVIVILMKLGYTKYLFVIYVLCIPIFAGYDRYFGDILYEVTGWIAKIGITQGALFAVTLALFCLKMKDGFKRNKNIDWLFISVIFFFIIVTISLTYAPNDELAGKFFLAGIPWYFLAYIAALYSIQSIKDAKQLFQCFVLCVTFVIISRYLYQDIQIGERINVNYIYGGAVNYSLMLVLILPFSIYFASVTKEKWPRRIFLISSILVIMEILLTETRGAYAAAFISMIYYGSKTKTVKYNYKILFPILLLIIVGYYFVYFRMIGDTRALERSDLERFDHLKYYSEMWREYFYYGAGFAGQYLLTYGNGSHNTFLSVAVDTGLVGLIVLILVYVFFYIYTNKSYKYYLKNRESAMFIVACKAGIIAQIVHANTTGDEFLYSVPIQIIIFIFIIFAVISKLSYAQYNSG